MKNLFGSIRFREILASIGTGLIGSVLFAYSWVSYHGEILLPGPLVLGLFLMGFTILADRFPIHLRYVTKVSITSVPLYLMAMLLPQPLAIAFVLLTMGIAGVLARKERGLKATDIFFDTFRWVIVVFVGSFILHLPVSELVPQSLLLIAAAASMFLSDILTFSLYTSIIVVEQTALLVLIRESTRQASGVEGIQYMIGLLGVLAYYQAPWSLALLFLPCMIVYRAFKRVKEMQQGTREILERTADAVDQRDFYTGFHSRRVEKICRLLVDQLNIFGPEAELICLAARLHDIGKGEIPLEVLHKPGVLSDEEWQLMQMHCEAGARLVSQFADFNRGSQMILYHHERWNGKGYPRGLKGQDIPLGARLIAVADAFDAMISDRPYRRGLSREEAKERLIEGRGIQWDPLLVDALLACIDKEEIRAGISVAHAIQIPVSDKPRV